MRDLIRKTKSGINARDLELAQAEATKCKWGFDPTYGILVLPNYNPSSGDVDERFGLYLVDGSIVVEPLSDVRAALAGFCADADVSATSVTISGCLPLVDLVVLATRQLTATVLPSGSVQTGTWSSDDELIATVSVGGLVTGVAAGEATITFTSTDGGFQATCVVTVVEA